MVDFNRTTPPRTPIRTPIRNRVASLRRAGIKEIVIVDSRCELYGDFIEAAQAGEIGLQFCEDTRAALRLAGQFHADAWLVNVDQPDRSGLDLLEMLSPIVSRGTVSHGTVSRGTVMQTHRLSGMIGNRTGRLRRPAVFGMADHYSPADEKRALACGVAGYLVGPVTLEGIRGSLELTGEMHHARVAG